MESLSEFRAKAERKRQEHNKFCREYLREHYQYARSKGFTSAEAQLLSGRSKGVIDSFAKQKEAEL